MQRAIRNARGDARATPEVLVTVDYEMDGLGWVDFERAMLAPTDRLLAVCERHGYVASLFVDVSELRALAEHPDHGAGVERVREQLRGALDRGHRVELHLHPQWDEHREQGPRQFSLDVARWRIANLEADEIATQLRDGRAWLERWLDTEVVAFRAGAWGIQPSAAVLDGLAQAGLRVDSTVAPGTSNRSELGWYDFRKAPAELPWWRVREDVLVPAEEAPIVEMPITTGRTRARDRVGRALRDRWTGDHAFLAEAAPSVGSDRDWRATLHAVRRLRHVRLDPAVLDASPMLHLAEEWVSARGAGPIVLITHSKSFSPAAERALDGFLAGCQRRGWTATSYAEWLADLG
ncbi:MAG: hypothetical protein EP330_05750 [Deltaproteobacteria bacterium]|nr:MAG: hypothetical protein EP330_05750 [Deltaproteobacteria bacterium]